jgi:hypothetical protein
MATPYALRSHSIYDLCPHSYMSMMHTGDALSVIHACSESLPPPSIASNTEPVPPYQPRTVPAFEPRPDTGRPKPYAGVVPDRDQQSRRDGDGRFDQSADSAAGRTRKYVSRVSLCWKRVCCCLEYLGFLCMVRLRATCYQDHAGISRKRHAVFIVTH